MVRNNAVAIHIFSDIPPGRVHLRKKLVLGLLIIPELFVASSIPGVSVCLYVHCYSSVNTNYYVYIIGINHFCVQW